jgi:transcription-repair coupling factor (superfamily II helicase)
MNKEVLSGLFDNSPRLFQLADRLTFSHPQTLYLKNLLGSSPAFIIGSIFNNQICSQLNHLVICEDAEAAAYLQNTIENLTKGLDIFYFPSSFKNKKNFRLYNSSHVMLRTEALTRFASLFPGTSPGGKKVLITYPEALFEKVVLPKTLSGNIISLKAGDGIDPDNLMEKLSRYGFERTDFVYEPGQFAIRGGIIDIYSFGNEKPYRIELYGNDVDSIRIFDPQTQLSERKLLQVNIIPNIETQFDDKDKISLLEFLPANTIVWVQDWEFTREKLLIHDEELHAYLVLQQAFSSSVAAVDESEEEKEKAVVKPEDFIRPGQLEAELKSRHLVEFGPRSTISDRTAMEIEFHTRSQPAFNRQFELLIKDLKEKETNHYSIYLFADNPRQLERLYTIFADLKSAIHFIPVPVSIHEGFIDDDLKIVCYTDHQIFQRYHKYKVKQAYNKNKALTLRTLRELQPGDYVTHIDHGVGIYSGLQKIEVGGKWQEIFSMSTSTRFIRSPNIPERRVRSLR